MKWLYIVGLCCWAMNLHAGDALTAKVVNVGTDGQGRLFVKVSQSIQEPGCVSDRFDVLPTSPALKTVLSLVTTAKISGADIVLRTSGCDANIPILGSSGASYMFIK